MARTVPTPAPRAKARRCLVAGVLMASILVLAACTGPSQTPSASYPPAHRADPLPRPAVATVVGDAEAELAKMTLTQKIASLLMVHIPGTDAAAVASAAGGYGVGGLILMGDNIPGSVQQLHGETAVIAGDGPFPRLIATDQEGGYVKRLPWDTAPAGHRLASMPVEATTDAFTSRSELLRSAGITVNFGIIADQTGDTASFIYDRVLGTDPASAGRHVAAAVAAERGRVLSTLKHFPGHGEVEADSHTSVPATDLPFERWKATDAVPFEAGISAGAEFVMFGHLRYLAVDDAPASLSARWHGILTDQLGFDGISITDDMIMLQHSGDPAYSDPSRNAIAALNAGNTMLLYVLAGSAEASGVDLGALIPALAAAVSAGQISESTIDEDALKLLILRRQLAPDHGPYTLCDMHCDQHIR